MQYVLTALVFKYYFGVATKLFYIDASRFGLFQLMQADPQKLELRNDLLPHLPGPGGIGGIGGLGALGGPLPPTHDLTRPGSLFAAAGMCLSYVHLCIPTKTPYPYT